MYQLFFDGYPIYDPRDEELLIREPSVHLAVGEAGEMSFIIDNDHPYAGTISKLKGILELRADGTPIFKGRVTKDTRGFNLSRTVEVEGLLACLNDSRVAPFNFPVDWESDASYQAALNGGNVVEFFLGWLLDQHNAQVGPAQQIRLGNVTVTDPNNYISRAASDYPTTMETIRSKLADLLGGHLLVDYSGDVPVLHYYDDLPFVNTQVVEFGENLLDLLDEEDAVGTYTAILPVGKNDLTLASLPDGEVSPGYMKEGTIIYSIEAEELYQARIVHKVDWSDVTLPSNLRAKALAVLQTGGAMLTKTISVTAADIGSVREETSAASAIAGQAVAGEAIVGTDKVTSVGVDGVSRFVVGRYVQIESPPHGFSAIYPLMELDPDILNPANTKITLGTSVQAASDLARRSQSAAQEQMAVQMLTLRAHEEVLAQQQQYAVQQAAELDELPQIIRSQVTAAVQTSESIVYSALERYVETSNFEEFQKTVENQFSIMADEVLLRFTEVTDRTKAVDGDLQRTLETLSKYFEFTLDGLTIRAGENAMELALDNDLVLFRRNGQQFGWWDGVDFHTGNIVIGVEERAQFGSFALVPRANGLSFLEVGD